MNKGGDGTEQSEKTEGVHKAVLHGNRQRMSGFFDRVSVPLRLREA